MTIKITLRHYRVIMLSCCWCKSVLSLTNRDIHFHIHAAIEGALVDQGMHLSLSLKHHKYSKRIFEISRGDAIYNTDTHSPELTYRIMVVICEASIFVEKSVMKVEVTADAPDNYWRMDNITVGHTMLDNHKILNHTVKSKRYNKLPTIADQG